MIFRNRLHSLRRIASFCTVQSTSGAKPPANAPHQPPQPRSLNQFTKSRLTDFGELPVGEIPEALKFDRPSGTPHSPNASLNAALQRSPRRVRTILLASGFRDGLRQGGLALRDP